MSDPPSILLLTHVIGEVKVAQPYAPILLIVKSIQPELYRYSLQALPAFTHEQRLDHGYSLICEISFGHTLIHFDLTLGVHNLASSLVCLRVHGYKLHVEVYGGRYLEKNLLDEDIKLILLLILV